jgi:acyl carrier protein
MTATTIQPNLIAEVSGIVRKSARIPARVVINANSRLVEDLAIDSLDIVNVVLHLQDHFDVIIEDDAVPHLRSIVDLAAYLSERKDSNWS